MQSVLSPFVGRLSDVIGRKYLAIIQLVIAFIGSAVSARASSMNVISKFSHHNKLPFRAACLWERI